MALSYFDRMGAGMGAIVDHWLLANPPPGGPALATALLNTITATWNARQAIQARHPTQPNWRFTKELYISPQNRSKEKILEKNFARVTGVDWANQIPTASGLLDSGGGKCSVDLANRQSTEYSLFELKWESNDPLYAAIEVLVYGLVYLFSRLNREALYNLQEKPILAATDIHLRVLAPREYYPVNNGQLAWLQRALSEGITAAANGQLKMDFRFEAFPADFKSKAFSADGQLNLTDAELLTALNERAPVI